MNKYKPSSSLKSGILLVVVLGLAYFLSNFHRLALSVLSDSIAMEFSLTASQLGTLGSALFLSYALMQLPAGLLADRMPVRLVLFISCIVTAAGTILFALSENFFLLVTARLLAGIGTAMVYVPALAAIRRHFGDDIFGSITGFMIAMGQMGALCASAPLKLADQWIGWRPTFCIIGTLSILLGAASLFVIKKKSIPAAKNTEIDKKTTAHIISSSAISLALWFFLTGGCRMAFQSLWGGNFYMEVLEADAARTSLLLMFISLGCILGSASFGRISDRIGSLQALVISTLFLSVSWLLLLMSGPKSAGWLPVTASVLLGVFGAGGFAAGFSCIRLFTSSQTTGQVTGLCNCAAFLGSTFFTQIIGFGMDTAVILPAVPYYRFVIASFAGVSLLASGPVLVVFRKRRETKRE